MDRLMTALRRAQGKRAVFYGTMGVGIILIGATAFMEQPDRIRTALAVAVLLSLVWIGGVCICCLSRSALQKKLNRLLGPNREDFCRTIDQELTHLRGHYYDSQYRLSLFITPTWLILISSNGSVIRKNRELEAAQKELNTSSSQYSVKLRFTDGRVFRCRCDNVCNEVLETIKKGVSL